MPSRFFERILERTFTDDDLLAATAA